MERVDGIEPTIPLWKSGVLPLNYTREVRRQLRARGGGGSSLRSAAMVRAGATGADVARKPHVRPLAATGGRNGIAGGDGLRLLGPWL